jgi:predicted transposase YbfD/YdcC
VLTLLILAKLGGQTTLAAIARWVRLRADWLCAALNLKSGRLPCANTYVYVCQKLDLTELNAVLAQFLGQLTPPAANAGNSPFRRHLAIDGKTLVSTLKATPPGSKAVHLLELYEVESGRVLNQQNVEKRESEVTVAPRLMAGQELKGCLLTADAFHTQREWCKLVKDKEADWLLLAKANQPQLVADLSLMFAEEANWPRWLEKRQAQSWDKAHGRLEKRQLSVTSELAEFLADRWVGVAQVFCLHREISTKGRQRQEVVYGLTSLNSQQAGAGELLAYVRRHWRIENRLHWRKDVTLREDACLCRRGQTPQVLAALNNGILGLLDYLKVKNVPAQLAIFAAQPALALRLLVTNIIL